MILHIFRRLTFLMSTLAIQVISLAAPDIRWATDPVKHIGPGNDSIYRMPVQYSNQCLSQTQGVCTDWNLDTYDATITSYQATQTIVLEPGFSTTTGASLVLQIVSVNVGVPQASNLTGTADPNLNWIQASTFDQNGTLTSDSRDYYDNGGDLLQSQSKVFYRANPTTVNTQVLANAPIKDAYGRDAASTLPAPINYADFSYRSNFLQHNSSNAVYSHQNFDQFNNGSTSSDNTSSPQTLWDATSGTPPMGTLAWYYSTQNTWEPYTPVTNYPYTRQTWYQDGTGAVKKSAGTGEPLIMGSGHEQSGYTTPVADELDFYLQVRNQLFSATQVGSMPASLASQAVQSIDHDANGQEVVSIEVADGHVLVTERPGTGMTVNNSVTVGAAGSGVGTIAYFKMLATGTVNITGGNAFTLDDMGAGGGYHLSAIAVRYRYRRDIYLS